MDINDEDMDIIINDLEKHYKLMESRKKASNKYWHKVKTNEETREKQRETFRRYYNKNKDKIKEYHKNYLAKKKNNNDNSKD